MKGPVSVVGTVGALFITFLFYQAAAAGALPLLTIVVIIGFSILLVVALARVRTLKFANDLQAHDILDDAINNKEEIPPYILYLRPFVATEAFIKRWSGEFLRHNAWNLVQHHPTSNDVDVQLEGMLIRAFPNNPVIGLGKKGNHWRFGTIDIKNEYWKIVMDILIERAVAIVLIPSTNRGTYWEMKHIVESDNLYKTIFFMPPAVRQDSNREVLFWKKARKAGGRLGLKFPEYDSSGCLISFSADKRNLNKHYLIRNQQHTLALFHDAIRATWQD